jgi:biotin operon repressor
MAIYREQHTESFTTYSNALINSKLPSDCKNVLTHLLSKPSNWKLIKTAIAEALGLSKYAVEQAVIKLRKLGYLVFTRLKTGHGHWDVYETPRPQYEAQTRVVKPSPDITAQAFPADLQNNEIQKK